MRNLLLQRRHPALEQAILALNPLLAMFEHIKVLIHCGELAPDIVDIHSHGVELDGILLNPMFKSLIQFVQFLLTSLQCGNISLERGNISLQCGNISLERGNISLQCGNISLERGNISFNFANFGPDGFKFTEDYFETLLHG